MSQPVKICRSSLTDCALDTEHAWRSIELIPKVGGSAPKCVPPGRATALALKGTLQDLLLGLTPRDRVLLQTLAGRSLASATLGAYRKT